MLLRGGGRAGDQALKNAWRIGRTFPSVAGSLCAQPVGHGPARPAAGSAPRCRVSASGPTARGGRGAAELRPASFLFGPPPAIGRGPRARPAPSAAPAAPPLPPAETRGLGGRARGAGGRGSAREARPEGEGRARGERAGDSAGRARASRSCLPAERRQRAADAERERGEAGTRARALRRQVPTSPGRGPGAHRLGAAQSQRKLQILGKKVGLPLSPVPGYESPLKRKTRKTANLL